MVSLNRLSVSAVILLGLAVSGHADATAAAATSGPDSGLFLSSTRHFTVADDTGPAEATQLAALLEETLAGLREHFEQAGFELKMPATRLHWIRFSDPDRFRQYARDAEQIDASHLTGYYSSRTNRVVLVETPGADASPQPSPSVRAGTDGIAALSGAADPVIRIAHEMAHQLAFTSGLQQRGVMYPLWVSEGLATQYETRLTRDGGANSPRRRRLEDMWTQHRLIPLDAFITQTHLPAERSACEDLYAQAWGFFRFLAETRPDQLRQYLHTCGSLRPGFQPAAAHTGTFVDHFGPLDRLAGQWHAALATTGNAGIANTLD